MLAGVIGEREVVGVGHVEWDGIVERSDGTLLARSGTLACQSSVISSHNHPRRPTKPFIKPHSTALPITQETEAHHNLHIHPPAITIKLIPIIHIDSSYSPHMSGNLHIEASASTLVMHALAVLAPVGFHARLAPPEPVRVAVHDLVGVAHVHAVVDECDVRDAGPVVVGVEAEAGGG